jgi:hypothetical protein
MVRGALGIRNREAGSRKQEAGIKGVRPGQPTVRYPCRAQGVLRKSPPRAGTGNASRREFTTYHS